jgi:AcrR family transcriptional regulator
MTGEDIAARDNLMLAACEVVGRKGYKAASIARIAEEAGISIGHCYKFFPSRDAILDNVITWIMMRFEEYANKKVKSSKSYLDFEHKSIDAYFTFQKKHPFFLKILRDAEVETPDTWQRFTERRYERYLAALERALDDGEIIGYDRDQLPFLSRCLSSMRKAIVFGYAEDPTGKARAVETYDRFILHGLGFPEPALTTR